MRTPFASLSGRIAVALLSLLPIAAALPAQAPAELPEAAALALKARGDYRGARNAFCRLMTELCAAEGGPEQAALAERCAAMAVDLLTEGGGCDTMAAVDAARRSPLARQHPALAGRLGVLLLRARTEDGGELAALAGELGVLNDWWVVGPFANERGAGHGQSFPPERGFAADATFEGKLRPVAWRHLPTPQPCGELDLGGVLRPNQQVLAYAATALLAERAQVAALRLGTTGSFRVFLNGVELGARDVQRRLGTDQDLIALPLQEGANLLTLKLGHQEGRQYTALVRITALDGSPLQGVRASCAADDLQRGAAAAPAELPAGVQIADNARSFYAERARAGDAVAALRLATLLVHENVDGEFDRRDRALAEQAVAGLPELTEAAFVLSRTRVQNFASSADRDANPRRRDLHEVLRRDPDHVEAINVLAILDLFDVGLARQVERAVNRSLALNPQSSLALLLRAEALARLDQAELGWAATLESAAVPDPTPWALQRGMQIALQRDDLVAAQRFADQLLAQSAAGQDLLFVAQVRLRADRRADALALVQQAITLWPSAPEPRARLADLLTAEGDLAGALQVLTDRLRHCPEDDAALLAASRLHGRLGDRERQITALQSALEFNPNLRDEQRYLEYLTSDQVPFHQAFELDAAAVLAEDKGPPADAAQAHDPLYHVLRQRVIKAFANGTTSEYRHEITKVLEEVGARRLANYRLRFYSGEQRGRILSCTVHRADGTKETPRLRGAALSLPSLRPGDTVEIRSRIDDIAPTFFGDYFGLDYALSSDDGLPLGRSQLTVLAAPGRRYRHQVCNGAPGPVHKTLADGSEQYDWQMRDLPRDLPEARRPAAKEREPLVRMTTYRDWPEFASWWWNLIKKQMEVSPAMRSKVQELCAGRDTPAAKLAAIYRFVTTDVRYEAWEFGVHGYKPYNTSTIFERRHGDCKDKALLMCAMLAEVGIVARPVLIFADPLRSDDDLSLPMVHHFNHCIAWLPEQTGIAEQFLDGTAEFHPPDTLPEMDQGAQVLIVDQGKAVLRQVAWTEPMRNVDDWQLAIQLRGDGSAAVRLVQQPTGNAAVELRSELANTPAARREELERRLLPRFGKVTLSGLEASDAMATDQPVRLAAEFTAPELAQRQNGKLLLRGTFSGDDLQALASDPERSNPLLLGVPSTAREVVRLKLPPGTRAPNLPAGDQRSTPFGDFSLRWRRDRDEIVIERELAWKQPRIRPADYQAFREFVDAVQKADAQLLVVQPEEVR